ncbi:MAG: FAD-binding oxidoreductase, partial [Methanosarcinales archaeon]
MAKLKELINIVGKENYVEDEAELISYSRDGFPGEWHMPEVVVRPETAEQVSRIMKFANKNKIPVTPRGAGTSLAANSVPVKGGILLDLQKMNKILKISSKDLQVVVQPGVVYDDLNLALKKYNLFFPPDPGSASVCTIGGMVANNASGMRAVKYGVTRDYVLKLEVVLPEGSVIKTGSNAMKSSSGYDLVRLFVGSEGTLGVFTEITLRLRTLPGYITTALALFDRVDAAASAVSNIIGSGLVPGAIELL